MSGGKAQGEQGQGGSERGQGGGEQGQARLGAKQALTEKIAPLDGVSVNLPELAVATLVLETDALEPLCMLLYTVDRGHGEEE